MSRKPGYYERHFICRNVEGYYSNFNLIAKYNRHVSPVLLSNALKSFIAKNEILTLNFFRNANSTRTEDEYYQGMNFDVRHTKAFRFDDVVTYQSIDKFDQNVFGHVNSLICPVNMELPLWRVIVFESKDGSEQYVCVYFEHALYDGQCGAQFHRDLLDELDLVGDGAVEVDMLYDGRARPIPIAAEYLSDLFEVSYLEKLRSLVGMYVPKWVSDVYRSVADVAGAEPEGTEEEFIFQKATLDISTKHELIDISSEDLKDMLQFCRKYGVALTSYLEVIGKAALEETVFLKVPPPPGKQWSTTTLVAVNGRPHLFGDKFQYGCLVTGHIAKTPLLSTFTRAQLINEMKSFHKELHASVESKQCFKRVGYYPYTNIWEMYRNKLGIYEKFTSQISNLQMIDGNGVQNNWGLENIWFGGNTGLNYQFVFNVTTTRAGGMNIVVCIRPEFFQLENGLIVKLFIKSFTEKLINFIKE